MLRGLLKVPLTEKISNFSRLFVFDPSKQLTTQTNKQTNTDTYTYITPIVSLRQNFCPLQGCVHFQGKPIVCSRHIFCPLQGRKQTFLLIALTHRGIYSSSFFQNGRRGSGAIWGRILVINTFFYYKK